MRNATLIICIIFLVNCSAARRTARTESSKIPAAGGAVTYYDIERNNIGEKGIYIRKANIEINSPEFSESFTANLRISAQGDWLISIRSFAGIEVARIYADSGSVTILDRIGRTASIYDWKMISKEFGLNFDMLSMMIGDVPGIAGSDQIRLRCDDTYRYFGKGGDSSLTVDCNLFRPSVVRLNDHDISISYYDYKTNGVYFIPGRIVIESARFGYAVKLAFTDVDIPWDGSTSLTIPSNYVIYK